MAFIEALKLFALLWPFILLLVRVWGGSSPHGHHSWRNWGCTYLFISEIIFPPSFICEALTNVVSKKDRAAFVAPESSLGLQRDPIALSSFLFLLLFLLLLNAVSCSCLEDDLDAGSKSGLEGEESDADVYWWRQWLHGTKLLTVFDQYYPVTAVISVHVVFVCRLKMVRVWRSAVKSVLLDWKCVSIIRKMYLK